MNRIRVWLVTGALLTFILPSTGCHKKETSSVTVNTPDSKEKITWESTEKDE